MDGELIKVSKDIYKGNKVNIMFDILHIVGNSLITLLRIGKILAMGHDLSTRRRCTYVFLRVVQAARDVAEVEMNYTRVAETDPTIALRGNWSCLS